MIINGIDGQRVEFKIKGYEIPGNQENNNEELWLNIYLKVKSKMGDWVCTDASLTTWEVRRLIRWFMDLAVNREQRTNFLRFMEPNLTFKLENDYNSINKSIKMFFNAESRPVHLGTGYDYECFVEMKMDTEQLISIAWKLTEELGKLKRAHLLVSSFAHVLMRSKSRRNKII